MPAQPGTRLPSRAPGQKRAARRGGQYAALLVQLRGSHLPARGDRPTRARLPRAHQAARGRSPDRRRCHRARRNGGSRRPSQARCREPPTESCSVTPSTRLAFGQLSQEPGCRGEPACRRGSVRRSPGGVAIHLSGLPGDIGRAARLLSGLAPGGVCQAARVTPDAGALLPHRFTLACARPEPRHRRSAFCGTFLRVAPTGR